MDSISRAISMMTMLNTLLSVLITLLIAAHELGTLNPNLKSRTHRTGP